MTHSNKQWRKDAEHIFTALDHFDQLAPGAKKAPTQKVSFHEIFSYINNPDHELSSQLSHALKNDLRLRRDLNALLRKQAIAFIPQAVAASSGNIEKREADGFSLTLKPSQANQDQIYLIIEAMDRQEIPKLLFIYSETQAPLRLVIDDFYDGEAQVLLSSQDDIVKALRNHSTEVILR